MKILAITQARISSSRLPKKVLLKLGKETVLDLHLKRALKSKHIEKMIVASTDEMGCEEIKKVAVNQNCDFFLGSLVDVLDRFYQASLPYNPEHVIRLTSDCPLIDPELIDDLVEKYLNSSADYAANFIGESLPDGMDVEIFKFSALEKAWNEAKKKSEREHVTPYIRDSKKFVVEAIDYLPKLGHFRLTLDTEDDYKLLKELVDKVGEDKRMKDYVDYLIKHDDIFQINSKIKRNEGYQKSLERDKIE